MTTTYKVTYFPISGVAECVRLTLTAAGKEFVDERIAKDKWPELKPKTPMKALPILTVTTDGKEKVYCQSGAICRCLAKKHGLAGSNWEEELIVDEVFESVNDIWREFVKAVSEKDDSKKAEVIKKIQDEAIPKLCDYVTLRQKQYGKDGFIVGAKLSIADLHVFNVVDQVTLHGHGAWFASALALKDVESLVRKDKNIAAYLKKRPESEF